MDFLNKADDICYRSVLTCFLASGLDINGCVLSYFEGTANLHCYTSCTLTTLHCSKVSFHQCCHMKRYNKVGQARLASIILLHFCVVFSPKWRWHSYVMGATAAMERSVEFRLLGIYTLWLHSFIQLIILYKNYIKSLIFILFKILYNSFKHGLPSDIFIVALLLTRLLILL